MKNSEEFSKIQLKEFLAKLDERNQVIAEMTKIGNFDKK